MRSGKNGFTSWRPDCIDHFLCRFIRLFYSEAHHDHGNQVDCGADDAKSLVIDVDPRIYASPFDHVEVPGPTEKAKQHAGDRALAVGSFPPNA